MPLETPGLWIDVRAPRPSLRSPALFVDKDGTLMRDPGYVADPARVVLIAEILPALRQATLFGVPIVIVTNQSGIARGHYGWPAFEAAHAELIRRLELAGIEVAATLASAYYPSANPALDAVDHPMRKPAPGMLLRAAELLDIDLGASIVVGDKATDLAAGASAGLPIGFLIGDEACSDLPASFTWNRVRTAREWAQLEAAVTAAGQLR